MTRPRTLNQLIAKRLRHDSEDGAAMMLALVIFMLTTVISIIVSTFAFTAIVTSKNLAIYTDSNASVQSAISNALIQANATDATGTGTSNLTAHWWQGANPEDSSACLSGKAVIGTTPKSGTTYAMKWSWYSVKVDLNGGAPGWYIYASGYKADQPCNSNTARKIRVTLEPLTAQSSCYTKTTSDGTSSCITTGSSGDLVRYNYSDTGVFGSGILGNSLVTIGSSSSAYPHIYSYSSSANPFPVANNDLKDSSVTTNNSLQMYSHSTGLSTFKKLAGASCTAPAGGDTDACSSLATQGGNYQANIGNLSSVIASRCTTVAGAWKSSDNVPLDGTKCYASITFDKNYTQGGQVKAYTTGPITVNPGVQVNYGGYASNLQLLSSGTGCTLSTGNTGQITNFTGSIGGPNLICADTAAAGSLNYYGAIAAQRVSLTSSGTTFWEDDDVKNTAQICPQAGTCRQLWNIIDYRSYN